MSAEESSMTPLYPSGRPVLYLAPMQDVTDLPFLRVIRDKVF